MKAISARCCLPLLVLLLLLTACGPFPGVGGQNTNQTAPPVATQPSSAIPTTLPGLNEACPATVSSNPGCFTPHALRVAYGVESLVEKGFTGKGQTVIDIVSFGSPTLQQDMDTFDQQFGLPPIKLQIISPLPIPVSDPDHQAGGWVGETTLDVEIIHAIAPDANIVVLTSPVAETEGTIGLPEFLQLEQYAINNKLGNIVSQSWGASELTLEPNIDNAGPQELQQWDAFFQKTTTQQGMTYFASSGDNGATDYQDLHAKQLASVQTTSFPADDPWVTAVGGTTLTRYGGTLNERAWNSNGDASGGGFSRFFSTPSYQQTLPASAKSQLNNRRGVPDVSALADPNTGMAFYVSGGWNLAGGTSAAAPLWAGIMAVANQVAGHPLGFINPALYKLASTPATYARDFRDITVGNNTDSKANVAGYPAVAGWDPVTGVGSPIADKLIPDLIAAMK